MATFPRHIPTTDRILAPRSERGTVDPYLEPIYPGRLPGDPWALRGIPVIGYGIPGVSPGTRPDQ